MASPTHLDRSQHPVPLQASSFEFPPFIRQRTDRGIEILVARRSDVPLVAIELLAPAGGQSDPPDAPGLAAFTAAVLDEGTQRHTATEIASIVEQLGGQLSTGCTWNVAYVVVSVLAEHLEQGAEILWDVATNPIFPELEVERLRAERLADLSRRGDSPATVAGDQLAKTLYRGTVYEHPLTGLEGSLSGFERDQLDEFYRRRFTAPSAVVVAVGDLDPERMLQMIEAGLGSLPSSAAPAPPAIQASLGEGVSVHIVDRPQAAQTELRLGHVGVPRSHPLRPARQVMNAILGGKFTSRINLNLRERHGYTYGANTRFVDRLGPGPFVVSTAVANDVVGAACGEILSEIERIRDQPVSDEELQDTKSYLTGVLPYGLQTLGGLSAKLEELAIYELSNDDFATDSAAIERVDRAAVQQAARELLHPDRLAIVAVGPAAELTAQLSDRGAIEVSSGVV